MNGYSKRRALGVALLMSGTFVSPALAQSDATGGIADIVVTAQKREQSLQDVPVAVTALTQDVLQTNRVTNVQDISGLSPGLISRAVAGGNGTPFYNMRGVIAVASDPAQDRQIATYIDGVYIGGVRGAVFDIPDIQRIEVLRGPQGTLFGRNATAGAISVTTRDPAGELRWRQEVSVGTYDTLRTRTTIDTPTFGIFSGFVTYVHDERRGDVRNLGAGTVFNLSSPLHGLTTFKSPKYLGDKNAESVFAAMKLAPSDDFNAIYKFDYTRSENTQEARAPVFLGAFAAFYAAQDSTPLYGPTPLLPNLTNPKRPKETNNAWAGRGYNESYGHNLTINWRASDDVSFKNITAYRHVKTLSFATVAGIDGLEVTPTIANFFPGYAGRLGQFIFAFGGAYIGRYSQFSNELQMNYNSDLLTLTAGALYYTSKELNSGLPGSSPNYGIFLGQPSFDLSQPFPIGNPQEKRSKTKSLAAYAQAEVHITPQLDAVLGARITNDKKNVSLVLGGAYSPVTNSIQGSLVTQTEFKKTKPSFTAGLNYRVTDDILVYGKFATAYLAGGASGPLVFQPETVASWEGGLKSEFLDRRVRFNLAVYRAKYKDQQLNVGGTNIIDPACGGSCAIYGTLITSNGDVRSHGFEAELTVAPVEGLTLGGALSYNKIKWLNPNPSVTLGRPVEGSAGPRWSGNANAQYVTPAMFGDASLLFRLDAVYKGKERVVVFTDIATHPADGLTDPAQAPFEYMKSQWVLNGRIALRDINIGPAKGEIGLWGRNITDNKSPATLLFFGPATINTNFLRARTIGADFIVDF